MSDNNFTRGKQEAIDNALNVLKRLTDLSDVSIDAIESAIGGLGYLICIDHGVKCFEQATGEDDGDE